MPVGFTFPFAQSTGSLGYFEMTQDDVSATVENIKMLVFTNWGERVNRFYFGCNLREFLFEQMELDDLKSKIAERIINQTNTWLPFVTYETINILTSFDSSSIPENCIRIRLEFRLSGKPDMKPRKIEIDVVSPGR